MKLKNANFFQLHIEKILLAVGVAFLLLVVLYYLLGSPFYLNVQGQAVAPGDAGERVRNEAERVSTELDRSPNLPSVNIPNYNEIFTSRLSEPISEQRSLAVILGQTGVRPSDIVIDQQDVPAYSLPSPQLATGFTADAGYALMQPSQIENQQTRQAVVEMIGNAEPADFRYASVSATWDLDQWIQRLRSSGANGGNPIPERVWIQRLGLAGVYLQRQTLDRATNQWGQTTIIDPLPGQFGFTDQLQRQWSAEEATEVIRRLRMSQEQVARPDFVPVAGEPWLPPGTETDRLTFEEIQRLQQLRSRIDQLRNRIDIEDRSAQANNNQQQGQQNRSQQPQPRITDPSVSMGGGGNRDTPMPQAGGNDRQSQLRQQLAQLEYERSELLGIEQADPRSGFGPGMGGNANNAGQQGQFGEPSRDLSIPSQGGNQTQAGNQPQDRQMTVWAHDLTVEPGQTYRYRVIVSVINPLFRASRINAEQQEQYADQIALAPSPADLQSASWSEPVQIAPRSYFFVVQASTGDRSRSARVEVWRIFQGQWRSEQFTVQPGDVIGGTLTVNNANGGQGQLDMTVDAIMVDLAANSQANTSLMNNSSRFLYMNASSGQIAERSVDEDRDSQQRQRLQAEVARQEMASSQNN